MERSIISEACAIWGPIIDDAKDCLVATYGSYGIDIDPAIGKVEEIQKKIEELEKKQKVFDDVMEKERNWVKIPELKAKVKKEQEKILESIPTVSEVEKTDPSLFSKFRKAFGI